MNKIFGISNFIKVKKIIAFAILLNLSSKSTFANDNKNYKTELKYSKYIPIEYKKDVAIELGDSIFMKYNKGIGLSYNLRKYNKKIFFFLGNHDGMELGELGFRDYNSQRVNVFGVNEYGIQGGVRKNGNNEVGFWITDPGGMVIQGKDSSAINYALRVTNGHSNIGSGKNLFTIQNNGNTYIYGNLGILENNPNSTLDINGSLSTKVIVVSNSIELGNGTTYVYSGDTEQNFILPEIENTINRLYFIKNRGNGVIKLQCKNNAQLYSTMPISNILINPGESITIQNDGTYWITL